MTLQGLLNRFDMLMDTPESVPKLRRFILQLAVRGRLTERNSADTPANELLEPIRKEKERLYDAGTIRKSQAKLPEIAEDDASLPDGWITIELERAGVVNPRHDADEDSKASFIPMRRIEDGVGDGHTAETRPWGEIRRGYTHFMEGDVGLAKITPCFQNRKSTVFRNLKNGIGAGTTELYVVRPLAGTILPEFILSFFQSQGFIEEGVRKMTGTAGQQRVPREYVEQSLLPLPPLEEQRRIVETVDRLMDECDALEQQQQLAQELQVQVGSAATEALQSADDAEALRPAWERVREHFDTVTGTPEGVDALRQTILQLAVQGRLTERDPDDTPADELLTEIQAEKQRLYEAGEIRKPDTYSTPEEDELLFAPPSFWKWTRIGSICLESLYGPRYNKDEYVEEGVPTIRTTDMTEDGRIELQNPPQVDVEEKELEKHRVVEGDLLITRSGSIGTMAVFRQEYKAIPSAYLIRFRFSTQVVPEFVRMYLNSPYGQDLLGLSTSSTAQPNVNGTSIKEMQFPLPPIEEQQRIVEQATKLLSLCEEIDSLLSQADERGEQLLEAALRNMSMEQRQSVLAESAV